MIPVDAIEYVNVRIRGFQSRLLPRDIYENFLEVDNLGALTTFLLDHPAYSNDIESALGGLPEREGLERGVSDHFVRGISHVFSMSDGKTRRLFEIALFSFDLENLKAILLANRDKLTFHQIRDMITPCGSLNLGRLTELLNAPGLEGIVSMLSNYSPAGAAALRKAVTESIKDEPFVNLLNRFETNYYSQIMNLLCSGDGDVSILRHIFRFEIDLKNLTSALKFIREGSPNGNDDSGTFIKGGTLNISFFNEMSKLSEFEEALEMIEKTQFHKAVEKGIIYFAETGFFHEMERFLEEVLISKTQSYSRFHPFGVGVFIGYLWGQYVELTNLRTIINGIAFKTGAGQIRKGLIYV